MPRHQLETPHSDCLKEACASLHPTVSTGRLQGPAKGCLSICCKPWALAHGSSRKAQAESQKVGPETATCSCQAYRHCDSPAPNCDWSVLLLTAECRVPQTAGWILVPFEGSLVICWRNLKYHIRVSQN